MAEGRTTEDWMQALRSAGAAHRDAVGWHHIEQLAARAQHQSAPVQVLLEGRLRQTLAGLEQRLKATPAPPPAPPLPSPLAQLLHEMAPHSTRPAHDAPPDNAAHAAHGGLPGGRAPWHDESPRVQQFRQQLRRISVHKQVSQAMAQGPRNAGPINSHMLVLRALGLMRGLAPDYLNRFLMQVDTLLSLEEAEKNRLAPKKTPASRSRK